MLLALVAIIGLLINHSVMLDKLNPELQIEQAKEVYRCIGMDLVFLFLTFISYLWVDDLAAKKIKRKVMMIV